MYQIIRKFNSNSRFFSSHPASKFVAFIFIFLAFSWISLRVLPEAPQNAWDRDVALDQQRAQGESLSPDDLEDASAENDVVARSAVAGKSSNSVNRGSSAPGSESSPIGTGGSGATHNQPDQMLAKVVFYGDSQSDTDQEEASHRSTCELILNSNANPVFHLGDLLEDGTLESLNRFNRASAELRSKRAFYAAQGNNERNSAQYFGNFIFPNNEHWYSIQTQNLHIMILDTAYSDIFLGSPQYNWLLNELQNLPKDKFAVVMFHHPPYGLGGDTKGLIGSIVPLFKNYGVDLVISGHEHAYQKNIVDGIPYFISSGQPMIGYFIAESYQNKIDLSYYNSGGGMVEKSVISNR